MKKLIILIFLTGLIAWGCSENSNIVDPINNVEQGSLDKKKGTYSPDGLSYTKRIIGARGGTICMRANINPDTRLISTVKLIIPRKAFKGKMDITVSLVEGLPVIDFGPETPHFRKPLRLFLKLENLWFEGEDIDFVYFADDGSKEKVKSRRVGYSWNKNFVFVNRAKITHFSRYGFSR